MQGLLPDLARRLRETLSRCGPFESNRSLRAAFTDARIAPWRDTIPEATSRAARVDALITALLERRDVHDHPALALFVEVLAENTPSGDGCHGELTALATELRQALEAGEDLSPAPPAPVLHEGKYSIHIHGGQVGAIGDGTHVEGGIHFGGLPPAAPIDVQAALLRARRALAALEEQAAGYTSLTIPVNLKLDLEDKRREVAELEGKTANHHVESTTREQVPHEGSTFGSDSPSDSMVDKIKSTFRDHLLERRFGSERHELELYPLNCGDRGIVLGEQRLLVSSAFGMYFTGLLERDYNYVNLPGQIECAALTRGETLSGLQRIFWALQYPKGPRILIIAAEGGMGKSTLAAKIVRCMMEEEASDVLLGDSAKTQQVDPVTGGVKVLEPGYYDIKTFYARLVKQLGLPNVDTPSSALTAIKDRLVGRRAVIVVDNLETVQQGDELLRSLRAIVNRDVRAIITTRKVEGLYSLTVKSLVVHLRPLEDFESVSGLLNWHIQRYAAEYPELKRVQNDLVYSTQIMRLIERTGGIPLLLQLVVSDVARFSWEYLWNLPRLFGSELLAYLYETRWEELGDSGVAGEAARLILRYIVDNQYRGEPVTLKSLSEYLECEGRLNYLQPALSLLHSRFMVINQDLQRGNFTVVPSLAAFLKHVTTQ